MCLKMDVLIVYLFSIAMVVNGQSGQGGQSLSIVSIVDESLKEAPVWIEEGVSKAEIAGRTSFTNTVVKISVEDEMAAEEQFCQALYEGVALVFDITAGGWSYAKEKSMSFGIPYAHAQVSIYQWMAATDLLLQSKNATDAALIFSDEALLDQGLYYLVEGSVVRVIVLSGIHSNTTQTLKRMRPAPAQYVIFAPSNELPQMFDKAIRNGLVSRDSQWTLVMTSQKTTQIQSKDVPGNIMVTTVFPKEDFCCIAIKSPSKCSCTDVNVPKETTINALKVTTEALTESEIRNQVVEDCNVDVVSPAAIESFYNALNRQIQLWSGVTWMEEKMQILPELSLEIHSINKSSDVLVGTWSTSEGLSLEPFFKNAPIKRFFRIGTIRAKPWMYDKPKDPNMKEKEGMKEMMYEGYCKDLADKLSSHMNFEYEFVFPADGKYGAKEKNGTWNGLVGDLAVGETDIIVAPLTMTSEREEVIDFVAPYFDQSGISIVIRKKEREESLFKFMTVLKAEVWVSIVAALIVTGIMIWFLDKYSPYSAQNSSEYQMQEYRKFTLKESFWFALTSFTPQGGGEAPKALSGRTLVAAYWLFVVLMLATFTANLAAFLTVERMQSSVQSLEELAKQAKISYATTKDNSVYEYFYNMAKAEDELFRVWKELTLNSTTDQSKYRVWDYPIKEQYTHILQVIEETGLLPSVEEGLKKVMDMNGEFAFIHDSAELKYQVYHNCYLTEVGEPFAEQPYAIAVQQGSHLQDEISKTILELQKDRYFEALTAKYWNSTIRGECETDSDSEGINLQSLGGVFIATLIGLVLALIALAIEVMYYRRMPEGENNQLSLNKQKKFTSSKNSVSRIKVLPAF